MPRIAMPRVAIVSEATMPKNVRAGAPGASVAAACAGFTCGLVLGSTASAVGGFTGLLVTSMTGIPRKVTCLLGSVGAGALLVNFLGNSPYAIGLKAGTAVMSIFWSAAFGTGNQEGLPQEQRVIRMERGFLYGCAVTTVVGLVNPALGVLAGGILSNVIARV